MSSLLTLPLVGRVASDASGVGVAVLPNWTPTPTAFAPLRRSTLPTRGRVKEEGGGEARRML